MALSIAQLGVKINSADAKTAARNLDDMAGAGERAEFSVDRIGKTAARVARYMGVLAVATAGAAAAMGSFRGAREFSASMREVSTLVDTATFNMKALNEAMFEQAKAFNTSALEQSAAAYQIISAGASTAAEATRTLTAANTLAVAGVTDIKTAADGLTSVLNAYGNKVESATAVSDALFVAMQGGKTTIGELSRSIGQVAPLAASAGVEFDDLAAAVSALTKGGIQTSIAVQGVRAILAAVVKPSEEAKRVAGQLGLEFDAAALKAKGFAGFMKDVIEKTHGSTEAMGLLFGGVEALNPALALSGQVGEYYSQILDNMAVKMGKTAEGFEKIASGPAYQLARLFNSIRVSAVEAASGIFEKLTPAFTALADNSDRLMRALGGLVLTGGLAALPAVASLARAAVVGLTGAVRGLTVAALANPFIAAAVAIGLAATALWTFKDATVSVGGTTAQVQDFVVGAWNMIKGAGETALGSLGTLLPQLGGSAKEVAATLSDWFGKAFSTIIGLGRKAINVMIGNNVALGRAVGATVAGIVDYFRTGFEKIAAMSRGLGEGIAAALRGDFSFTAFKEALEQQRTTIADVAGSVGDVIKDSYVDYVGAATSAFGQAAAAARDARVANEELAKAEEGAAGATADLTTETTDLAISLDKVDKAAKRAKERLDDYKEGLDLAASQVGLGQIASKQLEIEAKATEAASLGYDKLAASIRASGEALIEKMKIEVANTRDAEETLARLALERDLIGATNRERAIALAQLTKEQELRASVKPEEADALVNSAAGQAAIDAAGQVAAATEDVRQATAALGDTYAAAIERANDFADAMSYTADRVSDAAGAMSDAFGPIGKALGGVTKAFADYEAKTTILSSRREAAVQKLRQAEQRYGADSVEAAKARRDADRAEIDQVKKGADARIDAYGDALGAAKYFFDEGSEGFKALQAAEAAYRAFQAAMTIQAMLLGTTETAKSVADAATKTAADTAAGGAKMFSQLGVYAFPAIAAMLAVMASLGAGSGGSGSVPGQFDARDRQARQGTGSVLGDAKAKSESIARSLEIVASNTNKDLEFSNSMLRALRSIDSQIGVVAVALARSFGAGGALDTSKLNLGESGRPATLFNLGFGSTTTRSLQDQGIVLDSATLGQILAGGLTGQSYQQVSSTKKKKAFGITYSNKTSVNTDYSDLDEDFLAQTTLLLGSLRQGVIEAAGVLGVTGADAVLNSFKVEIGKLSFKDLSGEEIQAELEAIFGKVADDLAGAVIPGLAQFQKVGEGLFETLSRVAREYQVVDVTLQSIGKTFNLVGVSSIAARQRLVDLVGGMDELTDKTAFYAENFLTEAERLAPIQAAVNAELTRLGIGSVNTRDQFKALVQSLDVSTAAGAEMYAALLNLAPAFAKITEEAKESQAVLDARGALSDAYEREAGQIRDTIDAFNDLARGLGAYRSSLYSGPAAALSPEAQYLADKAAFERVSGLAATGDRKALGELQGVSQAYLDASKAYYASSKGYFDDLTVVRDAVSAAEAYALDQVDVATAQLDALNAMVGEFMDLNPNVLSVEQAIQNLRDVLNPPSVPVPVPQAVANTGGPNESAEQIQALREELASVTAQLKAANEQRGAAAVQTNQKLSAITEALSRVLRESQAA